jgi:hypothetical protein
MAFGEVSSQYTPVLLVHGWSSNGRSVHIYFLQTDEEETKFANELWERIRRECKTQSPMLPSTEILIY